MNGDKKPAYIFINFAAGGVLAGVAQGFLARQIEEATGVSLAELVSPTKKSIGALSVASAGEMTGIPLFSPASDGSGMPRFTAAEADIMFELHARQWLPKLLNYGAQHLAKKKHQLVSAFYRAKEQANYHLNHDIVAKTLQNLLGDVKLKDMLCTTYISAHNYTAKDSANSAVMFSKEIYPDGRESYSHDPDMPIIDPMQASMAVPGHYRSKHIDGVGNFSDMNHVHSGLTALIRFKATLPSDAKIIYIEMGVPRFHKLMTPKDHDLCSAFDIISNGYLMGSSSNHSYSQAMQVIPYLLNGGEIFDLTPNFDRQNYNKNTLPFSENFLDASAGNMARILAAVETNTELKAKLKLLEATLLENCQAWKEFEAQETLEACKAIEFSAPILLPETVPVKRNWFQNLLGRNIDPHNAPVPMAA